MGKKKIRINFFSRLQSKKSTPPSLDGGILISQTMRRMRMVVPNTHNLHLRYPEIYPSGYEEYNSSYNNSFLIF